MKSKYLFFILIFVMFFSFNGCIFESHGDSLESFSQRMNECNQNYNMSSDGYIIDDSEKSFTKFFKFGEKELMLKFRHDEKNRLTQMHIVFEKEILEENNNSYTFISDCISSFCESDILMKKIVSEINLEKSIGTIKKETTSAEIDNIKIEIDTTGLGTVISLYKDI